MLWNLSHRPCEPAYYIKDWRIYGLVLSIFSSTDPDNVIDDRSDDEDDFGVDVEGDDTDIDLGPDGTYTKYYTWFFWRSMVYI